MNTGTGARGEGPAEKLARLVVIVAALIIMIIAIEVSDWNAQSGDAAPMPVMTEENSSGPGNPATGVPTPATSPAAYLYPVQASSESESGAAQGGVVVHKIWLVGKDGAPTDRLTSGAPFRFVGYLVNWEGPTVPLRFIWMLTGPCRTETLWDGELGLTQGAWNVHIEGSVPANCPGIYTAILTVIVRGRASSQSMAFTVE